MKFIMYTWLAILPLACGGNSDDTVQNAITYDESIIEQKNIAPPALENNLGNHSVTEQKIIRDAYLRFETRDLNKTYQETLDLVKKYNGYLQSDESGKGYQEINRSLVIKIPNTHFQSMIDALSGSVSYFDTKRISAKDVTEEFVDIEARLLAKRTLEARYMELLSKAQNVKDILEIERELANIREEIEARQGRLNYLQSQVAYSTIRMEFYKRDAETGITQSYGNKMWNAIKRWF